MFDRNRKSRYAPRQGGNWDPWLTNTVISATIVVMGLLMITVVGNSGLELIDQLTRWFGFVVLMIGLIGLVVMAPYWINYYLKKSNKTTTLSCLFSRKFENFLVENKLYVNNASNSSKIDLPLCELTKDGFRLSSIGNLRKTLLSDDTIDNLNSFLDLNGANRWIVESYYQRGWVNYRVRKDIVKDRLRL